MNYHITFLHVEEGRDETITFRSTEAVADEIEKRLADGKQVVSNFTKTPSVFEEGKTYINNRDFRKLKVIRRTPKLVWVEGAMITREHVYTNSEGDEFIQIEDPFKGTYVYNASDVCEEV